MSKVKALVASLLVAAGLLFVPLPALAQDLFNPVCETTPQAEVCTERYEDDRNPVFGPDGVLTKVAQVITIITGIAAVIMVLIGGIKYILSSGDSSKVNSAKDTIIYSLVGLLVAAAAQGIITFVLRRI